MREISVNPMMAASVAGDVLSGALRQIPSVFGRLHHLASLFDVQTGRYSHEALNHLLGADEADRVIRANHHQVFTQWLHYGLAEQKADLDLHISSQPAVTSFADYSRAAPVTARQVERQLFLTDLETVLELVRHGRAAAF